MIIRPVALINARVGEITVANKEASAKAKGVPNGKK
jgi:hypothetical protein